MIQNLATSRGPGDARVSIVLPAYNEAEVLVRIVAQIDAAMRPTGYAYEIIFVNDGSTDSSALILDELCAEQSHVRAIHLSRNVGHQAAVQAGLLHAAGDAIILMDCDLQDDPAALPAFLAQWREGYDVVYAVRHGRKENLVKRALFHSFYRVLTAVSQMPLPKDAGNFGLVDRKVALRIAHLLDRDRYFPGLRRWVGFRQTGIPVERLSRHDDTPRVSLRGLFYLAKTAIFSFSSVPLTMFYLIAASSLAIFLTLVGFALYHRMFTGLAIPGWTSTVMTASFFGALNALGIGILGEYVIRIYDQVRSRPLFIVDRRVNLHEESHHAVGSEGSWSPDTWFQHTP